MTAYDILDRECAVIETLADGSFNGAVCTSYNPDGSKSATVYLNSEHEIIATETYSYDAAHNPVAVSHALKDGTQDTILYEYDLHHNVTRELHDTYEYRYSYDLLERLTVSALGSIITEYTYDAVGNRLTETVSDPDTEKPVVTEYTYDSMNRLLYISSTDGSSALYAYDADGNVVSIVRSEAYSEEALKEAGKEEGQTGTPTPTAEVTGTAAPTAEVTGTPEPTGEATETPEPTAEATATPMPTAEVTGTVTPGPSQVPTEVPTSVPTEVPTSVPTEVPTKAPTSAPTSVPTAAPTAVPTAEPMPTPTATPTIQPTPEPTATPTATPTPTKKPTVIPRPTRKPTVTPTLGPTGKLTSTPTPWPTESPFPVITKWPKKPTPGIPVPVEPRPTGVRMSIGDTVSGSEYASNGTDRLNFTDEYDGLKGSTIWLDTLATSGMGLTAEEISALKLTDEELLTLGLTDEELLAHRLQNEVYSGENTSDGTTMPKTGEGTPAGTMGEDSEDSAPSARASIIITMDDELDGRTESELVTRYTYDSFNRLLRYSDHTGSTCYSYNADGYRTAKYDYADSAEGTRYFSIGGRNLFETSCAGSFTALNTYGTTLTSRASLAGGYEYRNIVYLYSAYGDVVLVADAQTGMKLDSYAYDPFGNAILAGTPDTSVEISESSGESSDITVTSGTESSASIDNPYGYRGYVKDDESGLYYLNARYYDSASGRFLTADTFRGSKDDPLSLNRYVYCQSNPVRYTDPSGHFIETGLAVALLFAGGSLFWAGKRAIECERNGGDFWEVAEAFGNGGLEGIVYTYGAIETTLGVLLLGDTVTGGKATGSGKQTSSSNGFDEARGYDNSSSDLLQGVDNGKSGISSSNLVFGSSTKSIQKLYNQMNSRGWTEELIRKTVDNPYTIRSSINKATGNNATVFYTKQGSYVIVDNITKAIVQISDNINPSTWVPDASIVEPYKP